MKDLKNRIVTRDAEMDLYALSALENAEVSGDNLRTLVEQARDDETDED